VCRTLREQGDSTPVLFVTARDEEVDRVLGLEMGGDDYVTKPFSPRELVARVKAVLRRGSLTAATPVQVGRVRLLPDERRVEVEGRPVEFTATEFDLLAHLMRHPGRVFSREELLSSVWGYGPVVTTRTVDVHVAQIRAKTGDALTIRTVRGVGYGVGR
jgi:two-component system, OmpR family, response regulator